MVLKIHKNIKYLKRDSQVIFLNRLNGMWIKIFSDIADILTYADRKNLTYNEVRQMLYDEEDRCLFDDLIIELEKMNFFKNDEYEINVDNVSYAITDRCNLNCKHCMVNAKSNTQYDYFDTVELKRNLAKIIELNPDNMIITGGEPMLRKDFFEISKFCRDNYSGVLTLMTNGILINEDNVSELVRYYDSFDISIDGYDEKTCSLIRGKGVFDQIVKSISLLSKNGIKKINTSMILSATNLNYIDEYIALNEKLGTRPMLRALSFEGRAKGNEVELKSDYSNKKKINNNRKNEKVNEFRACSCTAGYDQLVIEANGNIYPCNLFIGKDYLIENITNVENLKNYIFDTDYCMATCLKKYDPSNYSKCTDCDVSYFCWSCLYSMVTLSEKEFIERCKYKKHILDKVWS